MQVSALTSVVLLLASTGYAAPARCSTTSPSVNTGITSSTPATTTAEAPQNTATPSSQDEQKNTTTSGGNSLVPGRKAGISSGMGIDLFKDSIGWYYDWSATPPAHDGIVAVPMLWGDGHTGGEDAQRFAAFQSLSTSPAPKYVMGFEEPDCEAGGGSAGMADSAAAASVWDQQMGRFKDAGSLLISPSMCHQADETYLKPFDDAAKVKWDITNVHINKLDKEGIKKDLDHYASYGKPLWVSEFACVDDQNGFTACEDPTQINQYINDIVEILENDSRVVAYAFSNGIGLGQHWKLTNDDGSALSDAGQTYLNAIKKHAK